MNYTSQDIYNIKDHKDIITEYVKDLENYDWHRKAFKSVMQELTSLKTEWCINEGYYYKIIYEDIDIENILIEVEIEVCQICHNYFPYTIDIFVSSTTRQFCGCDRLI